MRAIYVRVRREEPPEKEHEFRDGVTTGVSRDEREVRGAVPGGAVTKVGPRS